MKNILNDQKGSKRIIIQTIRIHGSISRIMLTKLTGFSRATISSAISELIEADIIRESYKQPSTGGRPATLLELVPNSMCIVGANLENHEWSIGAFDLVGNVLASKRVPVNMHSTNETFSVLIQELKQFMQNLDKTIVPLLGIGVPGFVDKDHRIIKTAPEPGLNWYELPAADWIEKEIGWTTVLINRHRARGLAECRFGSGQQFNNLFYIGVGTGMRAGLYMDRQLMNSRSILGAGELGHTTILPNGPVCSCGNNGCLQLFASTSYIEQETRKLLRAGETSGALSNYHDLQLLRAEEICRVADQGDELATKVVSEAATYMGIGIANLVNLFNPEGVILGGTLPKMSDLYVKTAKRVMRQRSMSLLSATTEVKTASLHKMGGSLGAVNFALDNHLSLSFFNHRSLPVQ